MTIVGVGFSYAQNTKVNTDSLYYQAKELHSKKKYKAALVKVNEGLLIAPEYIDIRVLRIRICQQLNKFNQASEDLYTLINTNTSLTYRNLTFQQIAIAKTRKELTTFIAKTSSFYANNIDYTLFQAEAYLRLNDRTTAKSLMKNIGNTSLNKNQKYRYRQITKQLNKNQIGIYHEFLSFLNEYPQQKTWNTTRLEYLRYIGVNTVTARVSYSNRFVDDAILYELESYPVFSKKSYGFINLSTSKKTDFFQSFGIRASVFYTVTKWIEVEGGFRHLNYRHADFTSYVFGLTSYQNKFYLNARAFIGPKVENTLVQNYQLNIRYYFKNNEDYGYLRIGTGISPDESTRFTQITENPSLNSHYCTLGISKSLGYKYNLMGSVGYLNEDLQNNGTGNQISCSIGLKYSF